MPLETLDLTPPPLFRQGPSALARLIFCSALALLLMLADARFNLMHPLRAAIATVLYPAQWLALQPVQLAREGMRYLTSLKTAQKTEEAARRKLVEQSARASQVEHLEQENQRLRALLNLQERLPLAGQSAQVLYDATDPYSRRVVIDKGRLHGIEPGSPALDEAGVLGQVTRVYPLVSEITLLIDRDQVIPVLNTRTGARSVAYGDSAPRGDLLKLRYVTANEDVQEGDLLVTSGIDNVYAPGLPVARISAVDKRTDANFASVYCTPLARLQGITFVRVLAPLTDQRRLAGVASTAPAGAAAAAASAATPAQQVAAAASDARSAAASKPVAAGGNPRRRSGGASASGAQP
jgi:rod shape-determining protein MreC